MNLKNRIEQYLSIELSEKTSVEKLESKANLIDSSETAKKLLSSIVAFENIKSSEIKLEDDFNLIESKLNKPTPLIYKLYRYASIACIMIGVSIYLGFLNTENTKNSLSFINQNKEQSFIQLDDGSKIILKENSELHTRANFGVKNRKAEFKGYAVFDIAHDSKHPFVISVEGVRIRVLGTKFNVRTGDDEISTYLEEGSIEADLTKFGLGKIKIKPKEKLVLNKITNTYSIGNLSTNSSLNLTNNKLIFDNCSFSNIMKDLSMFYGLKLEIAEGVQQNKLITGEFENKSIQEILLSLKRVHEFDYEIIENKILIN